jgi:hypothetical protein
MNLQLRVVLFLFAFSAAVSTQGQSAAPGAQPAARPSAVMPSGIVQSALSDVQSATASLNISRWKAPGDVREIAQANVDSIQRDLGNTLPGLLAQADGAPESVPPSFAVYRNIDALYDVLLRVSEAAKFAAPSNEADSVAACLQKLEEARSQLGDAILQASQHDEGQIAALQAAVKKASTAPPTKDAETTVIDDGPVTTQAKSAKKKAAPKKPTSKPPAGTPATNPSN